MAIMTDKEEEQMHEFGNDNEHGHEHEHEHEHDHEHEHPIKTRNESLDIEALDESLRDITDEEGHGLVLRSESIDILSSSLDNIVKEENAQIPVPTSSSSTVPMGMQSYRKESDASGILKLAGLRKESDASALYSLASMSMRKDSDASALSALVKDEEEMMMQDEEDGMMSSDKESFAGRETPISIRKTSDPFENLRKLSDASDAVFALRKLSEESDPLKGFRKDSGDGSLGDFKSPESAVNILGDMKLKFDNSKDDGSVHLFQNPELPKVEPNSVFKPTTSKYTSSALEHLDILGSDKNSDDGSSSSIVTMNEANQKLLMDALLEPTRRNRAESWGGMSDISAHQIARLENLASSAAIDIPRGPSPHGFEGVIMSPRSQSQDSLTEHLHNAEDKKKRQRGYSIDKDFAVPLIKGRERLDSLSGLIIPMPKGGRERAGSFSRDRLDSWSIRDRKDSISRDRLDSLANLSGIFSKGRDRLDSLASLGEVSLSMSLGDLEDVAGQLESIVHGDETDLGDSSSEVTAQPSSKGIEGLPAPTIQVDSEAVQSAVLAAMAATSGGILDMLQINTPGKGPGKNGSGKSSGHDAQTPLISNAKIKLERNTPKTENKMEEIRARARAAAGYVHPGTESVKLASKSKKRPLPTSLHATVKRPKLPTQFSTPLALPKLAKSGRVPSGVHVFADFSTNTPKRKSASKSASSASKGGQSNQKWEEMFDCLVGYVKEQRLKETSGMSELDAKKWEWSGNVPTMYRTENKKALGRWINNQRSAKSKGSLKPEREQRLVSTGLKWSVLTTNAWTDMMEELKVYVTEKTKDGKKWDGNVPTNYKIKNNVKPEGPELDDEDKNLGRWINRQRSLYQAGKLKDDRRKQLEAIGLKWAVLSTTSWHTMYEALCKYAKTKREADKNKYWDGNVPASFETDDKPPKKLGRWVNRQRSAYANNKLKKEFVEKLERSGLKWTAMDSKKDLENSEVLIRQRSLVQTQRPIIRAVPQIRTGAPSIRPTMTKVHPALTNARPGTVISGIKPIIQVRKHPSLTNARPGAVISGVKPIIQVSKPGQPKQISRPCIQVPSSASRIVPTIVKSSAVTKITYSVPAPTSVQGVKPQFSNNTGSTTKKVGIPTKLPTQLKPGAIIVGQTKATIRVPTRVAIPQSTNAPRILVHGRTTAPTKPFVSKLALPVTSINQQLCNKKVFVPQIKPPLQAMPAKGPVQIARRPTIQGSTPGRPPTLLTPKGTTSTVPGHTLGVKKEVNQLRLVSKQTSVQKIVTTNNNMPTLAPTKVSLGVKNEGNQVRVVPTNNAVKMKAMIPGVTTVKKNFPVVAGSNISTIRTMQNQNLNSTASIKKLPLARPTPNVAIASSVQIPTNYITKVSYSTSTKSSSSTPPHAPLPVVRTTPNVAIASSVQIPTTYITKVSSSMSTKSSSSTPSHAAAVTTVGSSTASNNVM